jgi:hypothetical protein
MSRLEQFLFQSEIRVATPSTQLDEFLPVHQFSEYHCTHVQAPREKVYRAVRSVTAKEIRFFRSLTWLRRFGRPGPKSVLNPPPDEPVLDVATETAFRLLVDQPNREIVVGTVVIAPRGWKWREPFAPQEFQDLKGPGFALAAMNFLIEETKAGGCTLSTETRVYATDASSRRRFGVYWRVIYPGSAFIRRMWLRAIARRATAVT